MNCQEYLKGILDTFIYGVGVFTCLLLLSAFILGFWRGISK
jgi:hypothetical protein